MTAIAAAVAVAIAVAMAGCYDPGVACGDGHCAPGTVCHAEAGRCLDPEQLELCRDRADGASCVVPGNREGVCRGAICWQVVCGDGVAEGSEQCDGSDHGRAADCSALGAGFHPAGALSCTSQCRFDPATCAGRCGDGVVQPGFEACDGSVGAHTCQSQGFRGGTLACDDDCQLDPRACDGECGDGAVTGGESCDGTNFAGQSCTSRGFYGGDLRCTDGCNTVDTAGCIGTCGDGIKNGSEVCDGADLGGLSCQTYGWHGGTLACGADCLSVERGACEEYCGDGVMNGTELCDGLDHDDISCASLGAIAGALGCNAFCQPTTEACYWGSFRPAARARSLDLVAVWATAPRDIWGSSEAHHLLHFGGERWTPVDIGLASPVAKFWGSREGYVWAQTVGGQLAYHDGRAWTIAHDGLADAVIAATTPSNIWVANRYAGSHFDGLTWSHFELPTPAEQVFTFEDGTAWFSVPFGISHFDGVTWTEYDLGGVYFCVWGTGDGDLYADLHTLDLDDHVVHFDGTTWTRREMPFGVEFVVCGWSEGPDRMWVTGQVGEQTVIVQVEDGTPWLIPFDNIDSTRTWADGDRLWLYSGRDVLLLDGASWTSRGQPDVSGVRAIGVASPTSAWVGTSAGVYFASPTEPAGPFAIGGVAPIWGTGERTLFGSSSRLLRYVDGAFVPEALSGRVAALWGTSAADVWAIVGRSFAHYDGSAWTTTQTLPGRLAEGELAGKGGSSLWARYGQRLFQHDGDQWAEARPLDPSVIVSALAVTAANDVWFFDSAGSAHRYDGQVATPLAASWESEVSSVWAASPRNIWVVADLDVHHFDGVTWSLVETPLIDPLVVAGGFGTVWVGGGLGAAFNLPATLPTRDSGACRDVLPAYCNVTLRGHTAETVDGPTDCHGVAHAGEVHYEIEVPVTGRLTARVTSRHDIDVAAVVADARGGCDVAGCVGTQTSATEVVLDVEQGQTYVLVVGASAADTPFTLDVSCEKD